MSSAIEVEIFVDASCPYCHYGLATIRRLLGELAADPEAPALVASWRFLRLFDLEPPEGLSRAAYHAARGRSAERIAAINEELRASAAAVGVRIDHGRYVFVSNPLLAHRLLALTRDEPGDDVPDLWGLAPGLWAATFSRGLDLSEPGALHQACEEAGLEVPQRLWDRLEDPDDYLSETLADRTYAQSIDLDGVPRLRVGETIVPAWRPLGEVREAFHHALAQVS